MPSWWPKLSPFLVATIVLISALNHTTTSSDQINSNNHIISNYIDDGSLTLNAQQNELVSKHPGSLHAVTRALKMVIFECQHQMRNEPWDCPVFGFSVRPTVMFGNLMARNFKETSFVHALMSAAITHSITRACTDRMISTCGWLVTSDGGYSEDVNFGMQFSERFMNATADSSSSSKARKQSEGKRSARAHINFHNDEVGRHLVFNGKAKKCRCVGVTGSCSHNICWNKLPSFRDVANKLRDSLDQAVKMPILSHGQGSPKQAPIQKPQNKSTPIKRRPVARSIGQYEPSTSRATTYNSLDLLFSEESPDFCVPNDRLDIKGTKDRICSADKNSVNSCDRLCCGRGFKTEKREEKYKCECKFEYCCELKCNTCTQPKTIYKCL